MIYLDNAATTRVRDEVVDLIKECLTENYGNASSFHGMGRNAKEVLEESRVKVANCFGVNAGEIYFTASGTEANNTAIKGYMLRMAKKGKNHFITTEIEHHAVLHPAKFLEKNGCEVTYLGVDEVGQISLKELEDAIKENTALVSVMFANNEIGTVLPIKEISDICHKHGVVLHTDAVQAAGHIKIDARELGIDMMSISGHKFHSPKGVGALYAKKGIVFNPVIEGGAQEKSKRAGTENVAYIAAMARALELALEELDEVTERQMYLRDKLINELCTRIPMVKVNGDQVNRLSGNVNLSFVGVEGESMLMMLDMHEICASSGSACTAQSLDPSHVLMAIGLKHEVAHGSLRLSLSRYTTEEEIDKVIEVLPGIISRLREMSPLWEEIVKKEK